jgi:Uma2 family endonuclease
MSTLPDHIAKTGPFSVALQSTAVPGPCVKHWNREEYHCLGKQGWFREQKVELLQGELIVLTPQSYAHANAVHRIFHQLSGLYGAEFSVRMQVPLVHEPNSEPEPDISVVPGSWRDYSDHPQTAVLVVEVSKSSLDYDLHTKAHLYASMGIPDYWVLDLENRQLLVHRQPVADAKMPFGHRFQQTETIAADGQISLLENSTATIAIANMLPGN